MQGKGANQPDMAEFISALAAGNNAQLMVAACDGAATSSTLALVAAANQTGGRVICILPSNEHLNQSKQNLGLESTQIEFIVGEAQYILKNNYKEADFVIIDCKLSRHERVFREIQRGDRQNNTIVLGYNALCKGVWSWGGSETQLLPIGEGLLINRVSAKNKVELKKKSHWVVRVDQCTGEEHVFRVRSAQRKVIEA